MGRNRIWTEAKYREWRDLVASPTFGALRIAVQTGIDAADLNDLDPLMVEIGPRLNDARAAVRRAAASLEPASRARAVEVLLRANTESRTLSVADTYRLAMFYLTNPAVEHYDGRSVSEKLNLAPQDTSGFRKAPSAKRQPGELFRLLRDLHDALLTGSTNASDPDLEPLSPEVEAAVRHAQTGSSRELKDVARLIGSRYGTDLELTDFASLVVEDHQVIERLEMVVSLRDYDEESFLFHVTREFQARFNRYVVCIACGDPVHRNVDRTIPELRELIWLPDDTRDLDHRVTELINEGMLQIRDDKSAEGYQSVTFSPVPETDPLQQRLRAQGVDPDMYRLVSYDVRARGELRHYRSILPMQLRRARRHCAWLAEGPTYINRIVVDVSEFADAASSSAAKVHYFLPGRDVSTSPPRFERVVQNWTVRRHGFVICW